ncbi:hypothetical protein WAI453_002045 [Rhynchosporium graminicola]
MSLPTTGLLPLLNLTQANSSILFDTIHTLDHHKRSPVNTYLPSLHKVSAPLGIRAKPYSSRQNELVSFQDLQVRLLSDRIDRLVLAPNITSSTPALLVYSHDPIVDALTRSLGIDRSHPRRETT